MKRALTVLGKGISKVWSEYNYRRIYARFADSTMLPAPTYMRNLRLAERVRGVEGCVVECGVWRGGMSAGLASILGASREYYLFDSFEGLPPARDVDGAAAIAYQKDRTSPVYYNNCVVEAEFADQAMKLSRAARYYLIKGWFDQTVREFQAGPVALLRLDGDWYDSTMVCLEALFPKVARNGLIIIDDYYYWDGCSKAVHDFLSRSCAAEKVRSFGGVCYIEKT